MRNIIILRWDKPDAGLKAGASDIQEGLFPSSYLYRREKEET